MVPLHSLEDGVTVLLVEVEDRRQGWLVLVILGRVHRIEIHNATDRTPPTCISRGII